LGTKKPEELELIAKRDAPPELSDTAKAFVRKFGYRCKRSVYIDIKSKYLIKDCMPRKMRLHFLLRLMEFST
jgi:hypothetical protein